MTADPGWLAWLVDRETELWLTAVLAYGVGDTLTTIVGLSTAGIAEAGPIAAPVVESTGRVGLVAIKLVVFAAFGLVWAQLRSPGRVAIPLALVVVGTVVTTWNLVLLANAA